MPPSNPNELSEIQSAALATRIREEMARQRLSRQGLADKAKISLSTLEKTLGGSRRFTLGTVVRLEEALGVRLRPNAAPDAAHSHHTAPIELGGYSRDAVKWLEGDYLTLRPSFELPDTIYAFRTGIYWDTAEHHLNFGEQDRLDALFSQKGVISIPNKSGHIYLHTNDEGQLRVAILGRPLISGEMYGILTTLAAGSGNQLQPVAAPLALIPIKDTKPSFGRIAKGAPSYQTFRAHLQRAMTQGHMRWFSP